MEADFNGQLLFHCAFKPVFKFGWLLNRFLVFTTNLQMRFIDFSKSKSNEIIIVLTIIFVCTFILCYLALCYYEHMKFNKRVDNTIKILKSMIKGTSQDDILRITSEKSLSILQNCHNKQSLATPILVYVYIWTRVDDGQEQCGVYVEWLEEHLGSCDIRFTNTDSGEAGIYNLHSPYDDTINKEDESVYVRYLLHYTFGINDGTFIKYYDKEEGLKLSNAAKQGVLKAELVQDNIVCSNTVNVVHHEIKRK
ncbi:MAG: hypothetical protein LBU65_03905 [Planctomycetaceae bacterium]|nr:hypothetical protein [Planctomycetaceae bacterium]